MDNIGRIISAEYVFIVDVLSCAVIGSGIKISLSASKTWTDFKATPGKIEMVVTPVDGSGQTPYVVNGTIYCPRFALTHYNELTKFRFRKVLVKYTTGNGDVLVAGDKENPLKVVAENVNPSQANGYSGTKLTISGLMNHPELVLVE